MTEYLVLARVPGTDPAAYAHIGKTKAHGPQQAIKAVTEDRDLPEDDTQEFFVAVPARNWTEVSRAVKRPEPVVTYAELPTLATATAAPEPVAEPADETEPEPAADEDGLRLVDADETEPAEPEAAAS